MIDWTADFTIAALKLTGVPVFREGAHFQIPTRPLVGRRGVQRRPLSHRVADGRYPVRLPDVPVDCAGACSSSAFSILVPIVANWLRAYMIVMIGHLSGNTLAVGVDHIIYGWIFFGVVMAVMFFVGSRWREDLDEKAVPTSPAPRSLNVGWRPDRTVRRDGVVAAVVLVSVWKPVNAMLESVRADHAGELAAIAARGRVGRRIDGDLELATGLSQPDLRAPPDLRQGRPARRPLRRVLPAAEPGVGARDLDEPAGRDRGQAVVHGRGRDSTRSHSAVCR